MSVRAVRIALVHALAESVEPIRRAFASQWPEAVTFNLLDDSLSVDRAVEGELTEAIIERFRILGRYAAAAGTRGRPTDAILFTCSAFGPAIEAVRQELMIPVLTPNEAAFEEALATGGDIGLVVSFPPSLDSLTRDLEKMAAVRGIRPRIRGVLASGALEALQSSDPARHDEIVAKAAQALDDVAVVVLGQFSMARAASLVASRVSVPVLTTPESAVRRLRRLLTGAGES